MPQLKILASHLVWIMLSTIVPLEGSTHSLNASENLNLKANGLSSLFSALLQIIKCTYIKKDSMKTITFGLRILWISYNMSRLLRCVMEDSR